MIRFPLRVSPTLDRRRPGVLADVGEQFARGPVQQLLRLRLADIFEVGFDGNLGASLELPQQFSNRQE